jgi:hypothetical protein
MIGHIVMWKLKQTAKGRSASENAQIMKEMLEALPQKIAFLRTLAVSTTILAATLDTDVILYTVFDSAEDLEVYQVHPEHQKCVEFISQVVAERRVVDYSF